MPTISDGRVLDRTSIPAFPKTQGADGMYELEAKETRQRRTSSGHEMVIALTLREQHGKGADRL